jgi:6-phosphogluconolactonase
MTEVKIHVARDARALARDAAELVIELGNRAIELSGHFRVFLAGGSTPRALYELLATNEYSDRLDWTRTRVFFGDERCVPPDHEQSNYRMARESLLSRVPVPASAVHRIQGELDPETAAKNYGMLLKTEFASANPDLVLLGMGEDGHTASLFPNTAVLAETEHRCVAVYVEKLQAWRVTVTAWFLNRAHDAMILVSGAAKAATLAQVLEGQEDTNRWPVQLIRPAEGRLHWFLDADAAGMSDEE